MRRPHEHGVVLIISLVFGALLIMMSASVVSYTTIHARSSRASVAALQARVLAEAAVDKAVYELNQNSNYAGETDTALGDGVFSVSIENIDSNTKRIVAEGFVPTSADAIAHRTVRVTVSIDTAVVSFHYGVQVGEGGLELQNSSIVNGNIHASGIVTGENSNIIRGDVISSGAEGLVDGIHATSSVYAHTIQDSTIDGDAHYQVISDTVVTGTEYPDSTDQATSTLPISDELIELWKDSAEAGGTHNTPCPYVIDESVTLGPKKINCDLKIKGNSTIVTLADHVWVSGNIEVEGSSVIRASSALGVNGVALIADNESDRLNSSTAVLQNSAVFEGSGTSGSHVLVVSQNNSAENAGSNTAIVVKNTVSGDLLVFAGHGLITLENSIDLSEVTAWEVHLKNTAEVTYDSGISSTLFASGPGGSWAVLPGTYTLTP